MKSFRTVLLSAGGTAALVIALGLIAPRAAHAIAAALVQVTNTTANPAITQSTAQQASQLIRLNALASVTNSSACNNDGDEDCHLMVQINSDGSYVNYPTGYTVPAGQKLVITTVSFYPNLNNTSGFADIELRADTNTGGFYGGWLVDRTRSSESHPTGVVVGSGHAVLAVVTMIPSAQMTVELQGYLTAN